MSSDLAVQFMDHIQILNPGTLQESRDPSALSLTADPRSGGLETQRISARSVQTSVGGTTDRSPRVHLGVLSSPAKPSTPLVPRQQYVIQRRRLLAVL